MNRLDQVREHVLGLYRIVIGFLFACHGVKSVFGLLGAKAPVAFGVWPGWWAAAIQLVAGVLVCVGLGTRVAAFLGAGSMAYAYFFVHAPTGLFPIQNGGEASAMFCWTLVLLVFTGAGKFAVQNMLSARRAVVVQAEVPAPREAVHSS